eukprot:scaffold79346_cov43-Cyclotella_meneghiniana.AAC.3
MGAAISIAIGIGAISVIGSIASSQMYTSGYRHKKGGKTRKWREKHKTGTRVCYPRNLTPRVGTRVWRADQVRARRGRVGSRVYPITLRSSRVGIPPTKIPVPGAFYPGIGCRVSTRGTDSPLRKVARYPSMIPDWVVMIDDGGISISNLSASYWHSNDLTLLVILSHIHSSASFSVSNSNVFKYHAPLHIISYLPYHRQLPGLGKIHQLFAICSDFGYIQSYNTARESLGQEFTLISQRIYSPSTTDLHVHPNNPMVSVALRNDCGLLRFAAEEVAVVLLPNNVPQLIGVVARQEVNQDVQAPELRRSGTASSPITGVSSTDEDYFAAGSNANALLSQKEKKRD